MRKGGHAGVDPQGFLLHWQCFISNGGSPGHQCSFYYYSLNTFYTLLYVHHISFKKTSNPQVN